VGREICERQGIKALLIGTITSFGSHYVITLEAMNAHTGDPIATEQVEAESKEKVLSSLGRAAGELRQKLGESLSTIQKYRVGIEQATTSSLDALKAFTQGNDARSSGRQDEALTFYQKAIELDPNFAMAYARIAVFYGNRDEIENAKKYVYKAFDLRDRVSEREKLYISEKYYIYVTGEIDKAIEVLQAWANQYPNDYIPHNNLAGYYLAIGQLENARIEAQKAAELSPNNASARDNVTMSFIALDRFDEAELGVREQEKISKDSASVIFHRYLLAFLRGDKAAMDAELTRVKGRSEEADARQNQALVAIYYGKLSEGERLMKEAVEMFKAQNRTETQSQSLVTLALRQSVFGKCQQAKQNVKAGLALGRGRMSLAGAALAFAVCSDTAQAESINSELLAKFPNDQPTQVAMVPFSRAVVELNRGNAVGALQIIDPLTTYDFSLVLGNARLYLSGMAHLQQKKGQEAAAEFEKILSHRGVDPFAPEHQLAHLGLARASVLMGDAARAKKEYQDFLAAMKDADPDLTVLAEAKRELAAVGQ